MNRIYLCIDLKSFYASVECVARELDPLTTNLVVADKERTDKTICLAVTPSLKAYGISGRARLFEVVQRVEEINRYRRSKAPGRKLDGESYDDPELKRNPSLALSYIVAPPRMSYYMETSARIYDVYLKFIAPEDIHVYSIDEVFIDLTPYLKTYQKTPREMAEMLIKEVLTTTGITATAGIGTNMYLAKVAMDITAKKMPADENGVRIAELDEMSYRRELWTHRPLTDFWMVGRGISKKLEDNYMFTMGDVARCSQYNEAKLYKLFGVNAELLIDRAWGREPTTIADVKAYRPSSNSLSMGQVLHLSDRGVPTKNGKEKWKSSKISYMLSNERYIGDCCYQKTYRGTTVPFKQSKNRGEEDMYYATGTHAPIVEKDLFEKVQVLLKKRKEQFTKATTQNIYPLSSRIRCSECGSFYRRKVRSGGVKWVCARHEEDFKACNSNYYSEERRRGTHVACGEQPSGHRYS